MWGKGIITDYKRNLMCEWESDKEVQEKKGKKKRVCEFVKEA